MTEQIGKPKRLWILVIVGILTIVCGLMMSARPFAGLLWMSVITGCFFIVDGLVEIFAWFRNRALLQTPVFVLILAVLSVILGGMIIAYPIAGIDALVIVSAAALVATGIMAIVLGIKLKDVISPGWGLILFSGILDIVLGFFLFGHPGLLAVLVGVALMMRGISFISLGLQKY